MLNLLQQRPTKKELVDDAKFFALLNAGLIATALGIALFKTPNHFAFGGTSGLSIILSTLFPKWNVGFFMWVVNAALVLLGFAFLGVRSMGWTIYSSFALSFYVSLCEKIWPLTNPLTQDVFLELCYAVILPAVGSAIVFNIGASTGGTDIVAMICTNIPAWRSAVRCSSATWPLCWWAPTCTVPPPGCTAFWAWCLKPPWWTAPSRASTCARSAPW